MKTGQTVAEFGLYLTECCNTELVFDVGYTLSRCPRCQHLCEWEYEDELGSSKNVDQPNGMAA